jgi:hypothetical protein
MLDETRARTLREAMIEYVAWANGYLARARIPFQQRRMIEDKREEYLLKLSGLEE